VSIEVKKRIEAMSLSAGGTIRQAMQAINQGALGLSLLIDPETKLFVGVVTDGDIRRALLSGHGLESPVANVPRPESKVAHCGMSLDQVANLFSDPVRVVPLLNDRGEVADLAVLDRRMYLPVAEPMLGEKELLYVTECVLTGWVSSAGKFVTRFEQMFAEFCGTDHAIAVSNGTTALHVSLLSLGIGLGDEVIVPTLTFIATANAVTYTGARPVFVDSEINTWNIDPDKIEEAITPRTKAIIPVHLYGHPADMDRILDIASKHGLAVIEDAAEAHGACYKGRKVGGFGDIGIFSFFGNKIITTGEGGMVVTNNSDLAQKVRMLRDHGMDRDQRYLHPILGYNYRLTNIQAAIGVAQLEKIENIIERKKEIADLYAKAFITIPGITMPPKASWADNVYWLYSIIIDEEKFGYNRDSVMTTLTENGVECRPLFIPCHLQPIYATGQLLPVATALAEKGLSLPSSVNLTKENVKRITDLIRGMKQSTV
jgi:perosamine synthetase